MAAIVFTDVAGFSRVAGLNEPRALDLLHRDFDVMRSACGRHCGRVLNVMGDGLLMMFGSAVEAMQCALEIQARLFDASKVLPSDKVLHHRIGVHLGDVILDDGNIFGDGVNVASRLQAEARPDTICFSRTVYDVIKNKVNVDATYLGPRSLKNIPERVMVWQSAAPSDMQSPARVDPFADLSVQDPSSMGLKTMGMIGASVAMIVCVVMLVLGVRYSTLRRQESHEAALPAVPIHKTDPGDETKPSTSGRKFDESSLDQAALAKLKTSYEFANLVASLKEAGVEDDPDGPGVIQKYQSLADMRSWLDQQLSGVTQDAPIRANVSIGGTEVPCTIYQGPSGVVIDPGNSPQITPVWSLPPGSILNIATAAAQLPQAPPNTQAWITQFAQEYGLR